MVFLSSCAFNLIFNFHVYLRHLFVVILRNFHRIFFIISFREFHVSPGKRGVLRRTLAQYLPQLFHPIKFNSSTSSCAHFFTLASFDYWCRLFSLPSVYLFTFVFIYWWLETGEIRIHMLPNVRDSATSFLDWRLIFPLALFPWKKKEESGRWTEYRDF